MANISSLINRFNLVKQIPIFAKLNWFDLQKIARKTIVVEFAKGDVIAREGTPPDYFYCLVSGRLEAYTQNPKTQAKENIDFIHRGMHFGIISVLTGENHSMTFEAINDSIILKIQKDDFQAILKAIPQLGLEFSEILSKRIRRKVKGTHSTFESTIISVYSPVKGTGSSTYAINLALNLERETKRKVLYINIHTQQHTPQGNKPGTAEASPKWKTQAVLFSEIVDDYEKIRQSVIEKDLSVDLLNVVFETSDTSMSKQIGPFVSAFVGDYHYVIVDLPNDMDDVVFETLAQSDIVHLITSERKKDLGLIRRVIDRLQDSLRENFKQSRVRVIIRSLHAQVYLSFEELNQTIDYDVYLMLPFIHRDELTVDVQSQHLNFLRCAEQSEYAQQLRRIARQIGGVRVGVVLGGGAALGIAHIGVIRVLEEERVPVDVIVGSSMGALIGSMWALGKDSDQLEVVAREFEKKINMLKLFDPVIPLSGLIGGRAIKRWLRKHMGDKIFYSTKIPLKIISYDLVRREEKVINSGSIVEAVRESIAIPGVIEPVQRGEQVIIDGGVLNPLPTNVPAALGIKKIIAVNVLQSPDDVCEGFDIEKHKDKEAMDIPFLKSPWHYLTYRLGRMLGRIFTPNISDIIVRTLQATEYVIAEQSAQQADVVIHPDLVGVNWYELNRVDELIKAGEDATRELLPEIKKLVEE